MELPGLLPVLRSHFAVSGRLAPEGVCGEREGAGPGWTIRLRLTPWAEVGCAPSAEPLEIQLQGSRARLLELQRRCVPGSEVRALVRPGERPLKAELVRLLG